MMRAICKERKASFKYRHVNKVASGSNNPKVYGLGTTEFEVMAALFMT